MRAARLHELGGLPQVDEIDPPEGHDADSLIRVTSSTLNPVDIAIGNGRFYGGTPPFPYVIGSESIGVNAAGRRVWARGRNTMAEQISLEDGWLFEVPDGVSDGQALACGTAGLTGWLAVSWVAPVRPDDVVLVLGASGTLGTVAVQAAKVLGAKKVIGAARSVEAITDVADEVFDLTSVGELPEASLIIDGLWGDPLARALAAASPGVRVVQLGQSAGGEATLRSDWIRGKRATIFGLAVFATPVEVAEAAYQTLCGHVGAGRIVVELERYPLDRIADAWKAQGASGSNGKLVIDLQG